MFARFLAVFASAQTPEAERCRHHPVVDQLPPAPIMESSIATSKLSFLSLPTEIRLEILSYVLHQDEKTGFIFQDSSLYPFPPTGLYIDALYSAATRISPLLTCRQFRDDFTQVAFRSTNFIITDTFTPVSKQLAVLQPYQISALRNVTYVVAETQVREMCNWKSYPWDIEWLNLDTLSVVFHRSGQMHYPHDFTHKLVALLRRLQGVKRLRFVRNGANIKGFFKTWYNRLVGLILKEDHHQRYDFPGAPHLPASWWEWSFDEEEQSFEFVAKEPVGVMEESEYLEMAKPYLDALMKEIMIEEMDPDPRARVGW